MAGLTIAEKILSSRSGTTARAGDYVVARVDRLMAHDGNRPIVTDTLAELGFERPAHPDRFVLVLDHAVPPATAVSANIHARMRSFAAQHGARLTEAGEGICHLVLPEQGLVTPGMLVIGSDSHTTTLGALNCLATGVGSSDLALALARGELWFRVPSTLRVALEGRLGPGVYAKDVALALLARLGTRRCTYRAIEFSGALVDAMEMDARFTLANVAVELGAKCGIFPGDEMLRRWLEPRHRGPWELTAADPDAVYEETVVLDVTDLAPQVARPHSPQDVVDVGAVEGTAVGYVFIGSCSAGRLSDLRAAAALLRGRAVARGVRLIVVPGSHETYRQAVDEGLVAALLDAGATIVPPGCGPCAGVSQGVPADGETVLATSPRNFRGRMGNPNAGIFLASPATAAAAAREGVIVDVRRILASGQVR